MERRKRDQRNEDDFDCMIEDLGIWQDKRVRAVTSNIDKGRIIYESGLRS